jgi:tetratricopeptide (TPR) repeat protein
MQSYDPRAQENFAEPSDEQARASLEQTIAKSFEVLSGNYEVPVITYRPELIELTFAGKAPGKSSRTCTISLKEELRYKTIDVGNNPWDSTIHRRRFTVSDNERVGICGIGWGDETTPRVAADSLYALQKFAAQKIKGSMTVEFSVSDFERDVKGFKSLKVQPEFPEEARKHKVLAKNAEQEGRMGDAIEHYQKALSLYPMWAEGRLARGLLLGRQGFYAEGVSELKKFQILEPKSQQMSEAQDKIYIWEDKIARLKKDATQ